MDKRQSGQNLVEFALILPILLTLVLGIINFAYFFTVHASLVHAAREGVRYGMVDPTDVEMICDRVGGQTFLSAPDPSRITVAYDGPGIELTCAPPYTDPGAEQLDIGDRVSVRIQHDLPALTPLIRAFFNIDITAARTISRVRET
ncbi:MAG: TadE family protein [Chloroflexota bacterium]